MKETIEIFQSKQTVVCLKKQDGKVIARGVARYNPNDEKEGLPFDYDFGANLAFERMIEHVKKQNFLKPLREACKSISKSFAIASVGIDSVNSAIKSAMKEEERIAKERITKSEHIQGDAVDVELPKIKTLKDGTKIIKQYKYEVGDNVLIKKKCDRGFGDEYFGKTAKIIDISKKQMCYPSDAYLFDIDDEKYRWFNKDIKGKVIE